MTGPRPWRSAFADEHVEDLRDHAGRRLRGVGRRGRAQRAALIGEHAAPAILELVEDRRQVGPSVTPRHVARDVDECLERAPEALDLGERRSQLGRVVAAQLNRLELDAQRGERRVQLVRGVGAEGALARHEVVQACRGGVERLGHGVDLLDAGARCAGLEAALAEAARGGGQTLQRTRQAATEQERGECGQRDHSASDAGEQEPGAARVAGGAGVVALRAHRAAHALADEQGHGDEQHAAAGSVRGPPGAQGLAHELVRAGRAPPGDAPAGAVVGRQLGGFVWGESAFVTGGGLVLGTAIATGIAALLVKVLTGVFDPPPDHPAVPWSYLGVVLALTLGAVWVAGRATLRALRRRAIDELRDL